MRRINFIAGAVGLLMAVVVIGCAEFAPTRGLELKPPKMAADSVMLEVFLVRLPPEEETNLTTIWAEIDEMSLTADLRQRLRERGFRGGVTGGRLPRELEQLLNLAEQPATKGSDTAVVDFEKDSKVSRRVLQMRPGKRGEILASQVYDRISLFEKQGDRVDGKSYEQAQCCFAVSGLPQPDGHVRLQIESELQHGAPRTQVSTDDISFVMELRRDRVPLDAIKIEADLKPGQLLVLGGSENSEGSVGEYFFTETSSSGRSRRLVLVRLAQSQQEPLFAPANEAP
jgi:hypothetical protein